MPLLTSNYRAPLHLFNRHIQTIVPALSVKRNNTLYTTELLELEDGDYLEVDWVKGGHSRLMVICHGLEGNSRSHYVQQTAEYFCQKGWDILALHARSCGRQMNRLPVLYHGGSTQDVDAPISIFAKEYNSVVLVGFSLGANTAINYSVRHTLPTNLKAIAAFSAPCDLYTSEKQIDTLINRIYAKKFLDKLKSKVHKMVKNHPHAYDLKRLDQIKSVQAFSANFTAPFSGFNKLEDFYEAGSCLDSLKKTEIPTLLVNAQNDPFLSKDCFPIEIAKHNPKLFFEMPSSGGHTAFPITSTESWMPLRIEKFIEECTIG